MDSFNKLLEVAKTLNSPGGCPWDLEQTFESLRPYILEEAHEVVDAVDQKDDANLIEELGDLLYTVIFYAHVAEREGRFTLDDILTLLTKKLIDRHPHVFGDKKADSMDEVIQNWERIKKKEKKGRKSALDGIPKALSSLQKGQKMVKRITKAGAPKRECSSKEPEALFAKKTLALVEEATEAGIDLDSAFREALISEERHFREWEKQTCAQ